MTEERFTTTPDGLELCYQVLGPDDGDPLLLIMGLGGPLTWWDDAFCDHLVERGFRLVRFDNRDTGRSSKLTDRPVEPLAVVGAFVGLPVTAPYSLSDLADDALVVLAAAGMDTAHVVGVSMGGMVAQTLAVEHPDRVRSLTSIMSTTGQRRVGRPSLKLLATLGRPGDSTRAAYLQQAPAIAARIGSPGYPEPYERALARAEVTWDRGWDVAGVTRHTLAVLTQPDRTAALGRLRIPVTVVHGLDDLMVNVSGGRATASAVPGSELVLIPGMGHDIPVELHADVADIVRHTADRAR